MTNSQNLNAGNRVTEAIVRAEPRPEFTNSWHPFSHGEILDAMGIAVKEAGLEVVNKEYSIRPDSKMLAAWEVKSSEKKFNFGISILNAIDKTHSVTLGAFEKIFICSNFCFRLEWERVMFRKHSGLLQIEEIIFLAKESLGLLIPKFQSLKAWHDGLLKTELTAAQTSLITFAALKRGVLPPARFESFYDMLAGSGSKYRDEAGTLWAWHGAATELMNDNSLLTIVHKQDRLNYFLDYEVPQILKGSSQKTIDLVAVEKAGFAAYNAARTEKKAEASENYKEIRQKFIEVRDAEKIKAREERKQEKEAKKQKAEAKPSKQEKKQEAEKKIESKPKHRAGTKAAEKAEAKAIKTERKALIKKVQSAKKAIKIAKKDRKERIKEIFEKKPDLLKVHPRKIDDDLEGGIVKS